MQLKEGSFGYSHFSNKQKQKTMKFLFLFLLMSIVYTVSGQSATVKDITSTRNFPMEIVKIDSVMTNIVKKGAPMYFGKSHKTQTYISCTKVLSLTYTPLNPSKFMQLTIRCMDSMESEPVRYLADLNVIVVPRDSTNKWITQLYYKLDKKTTLLVTIDLKQQSQTLEFRTRYNRKKDLVTRYYVYKHDRFDYPGVPASDISFIKK